MSFLDKMRKSRASVSPQDASAKAPAPEALPSLIQSLREQIDRYPNGRLYSRLAEAYREAGDQDKALQVARSGLAAFPNHGGLHYAMGLLHADKGERDEACKHLSRATELDKFDVAALKLLCQVLGELGRHTEAAGVLARIKALPQRARPTEVSAPAAAPATTAPAATAAPAALASAPAPAASPAAAPAPAPARLPAAAAKPDRGGAGGGESMVDIALARLVGHDGIEGAIMVDASGRTVAVALPAGQEEAAAAATLADLRRTASPVCGELGLGSFEEANIELLSGAYYLYAVKDQSLGIYAAPRSRPGLIAQHAQAAVRKIAALEAGEAGR